MFNFLMKGQFYQQRNVTANKARNLRGDPVGFNMYQAPEQNTR